MLQNCELSSKNTCRRCSVVEEPQVGVHQSDALLVTGLNHNLVSSRASRSCDVLNTTLQTDTRREETLVKLGSTLMFQQAIPMQCINKMHTV